MRPLLVIFAVTATAALMVGGAALLAFGRPAQPLPLGTRQELYEGSLTVEAVERRATIGPLHARGEFYIVDAVARAPFGLRPTWDDGRVHVRTFAGNGRTTPPAQYEVDERAQALLDAQTGRPGPVHEIRGAEQHERIVFDLPRDVEQPGLVFDDANDPAHFLDIVFGQFWQPHRFNLRYD